MAPGYPRLASRRFYRHACLQQRQRGHLSSRTHCTALHSTHIPFSCQAFIKERFDPALFYGVFNKGAPVWLDGIIHSHPGRQLLYELSSKHKNCLLLNFAIQKMLGKGYEDEVAKVGSRYVVMVTLGVPSC